MRNKILLTLGIVVLSIFIVLGMMNNSDEDLVGEIEDHKLFMLEIAEVIYLDGDYNTCMFVSSSIEFQDLDIMFDYVRMVCYYDGYLIFESQGTMYMTNATYTIINGIMIDDRAGLGGVLWEIKTRL